VLGPVDSSTLLVATARDDGHRDHRVVGEACAELSRATGVRLLEYPVWMWHWSAPDDDTVPWHRLHRLPLDASASGAKLAALQEFSTQHSPLSDQPGDEVVLTPTFLEHFARDAEYFLVEAELTRSDATVGKDYFDAKYGNSTDPWGFETRWYEQRKRAVTLASLPAEHYGRVLEIGCSIGVLTEQLAVRCDRLLALDVSSDATRLARERLRNHSNVTIEQRDVAADFPTGPFDLIVLSEVGYYFDRDSLARLLEEIASALAPGGDFLSCHWRHPVKEYPLTGDFVHHAISLHMRLQRVASHVERDFLLEVLSSDGRSVAEQTGLA
jgi:SAM-dependent methyltransferase